MNSVAYGFRDDVTDDELEELRKLDIVFDCDEHGVYEEAIANTMDPMLATIRGEAP